MAVESPLEHSVLRHIEQSLDEGNTHEAATRLGLLGDAREHKDAIDFLTTRLLFQRGRIDAQGAADRLEAILERIAHFPEAEDWLAELEGRTERSALSEHTFPAAPGVDFDDADTPSQPPVAGERDVYGAAQHHPFVDELDDDVTPAEASSASFRATADELDQPDSSQPPPRPGTRPPPTSVPPARPSRAPFDSLRAKSQLGSEAGRYRGTSEAPAAAPRPARRSRAPVNVNLRATDIPPGVERRILEALERLEQGRLDEAHSLIPDDPLPEELDPELRAVLARVLLELGDGERAAKEATLALAEDPESPLVRLAFAWSAVRHARQRDDTWSLERAARILRQGGLGTPPEIGLFDALTACVEARIGSPSVALRLAQRAVRANAHLVDGLAALAEAAAASGEERRAEVALEQLYALSESTAEQIAPRLRRLGIGDLGPTSSASIWLPLEHTLSSGAREAALSGIEALAGEALVDLALERWEEAKQAALGASQFLSRAPVFRHFGPYDSSLASIGRLEAGLGLLYGRGPRAPDAPGSSQALWQISGLYLGDVLKQCFDADWQGSPELLREAALDIGGHAVQPFQVVRHRIAHGQHARLESALRAVLDKAPAQARSFRSAHDHGPPAPWGDEPWPSVEELPRIGRAMSHSVVASYILDHDKTALDRSLTSLPALDTYIELVAPSEAPLPTDARWTRWHTVLLGAYFGEVLCRELAGHWATTERSGARHFAVRLGGRDVAPIALLEARLTGKQGLLLSDYVANLRHGSAPLG